VVFLLHFCIIYKLLLRWILCLPLINEILLKEYPEQPVRAANLSSALLNAAISGGDLLGPVLGGVFT